MSTLAPDSSRRRPTDQADVRRHNAALVLATVVADAPLSRARIAAATGLTRATVGSIVDDLLVAGLVLEQGTSSATGLGRPGTDLVVAPDGAAGVGVELNVDGLTVVVVDLEGTVRHRVARPGDQRDRGAAAVLRSTARLVDSALAAASDLGLPVHGVGIAVPGLVDLGEQVVRLAPNLGWTDVPVVQRLASYAEAAWPAVTVDNEANLAALGELWSGDHAPSDSFVLVNGDVGVGAGVVLDGRLHRGSRGFGGELGHLTVAPDGPPCRCGARGCLEQVAGLDWILAEAGLPPASGSTDDALVPLLATLRDDDARAIAAVGSAARSLGVGVAALVNLFDVDTVVLGGVFADLFPWIDVPLREVVAARVLSAPWAPVRVRPAALGRDAAAIGAALSPLRALLADPLAATLAG
ncbi:MAG TPA: ROK family transcriptional regulator [Candidatus Nanopelagicales bacterium]|nr:ROK family transcriptional regulator [Candidatus Nanopelagicales bacterium]